MTAAVDLGLPAVTSGLPPFAEESTAIWSRCWVLAGVADMIPRPGDVLPATIGDHGVHVLRHEDDSLGGGYNAFQQGSCWNIPAQCGNGSKVACAYVSCGHSRDSDVLRPGRADDDRFIRQVVGARPSRRAPVSLSRHGPLLFVAMPGAGPETVSEQMPRCAEVFTGSWAEYRFAGHMRHEVPCNWRHVGARIAAVLDDDPGVSVRIGAPNAVFVDSPSRRAVLAAKPVSVSRVEVTVALYGRGADPVSEHWESDWRTLLHAAGQIPDPARCEVTDWADARWRQGRSSLR
ncbi:hypothetical protein ACFS2C_02485 [Prauserella oleivorans]|uniref:Uncharacterized protein n=1 Tax=Prauserella oleivorans TaxID=1478153 RepID=A0ABW5W3V3_9PSEU